MTTTKLSAGSNVMSEGTMDRLIWAAWRAFWVGLGASAVLIGQSLYAPAARPSAADIAPPAVQQAAPDAPSAPAFTPARVSTMKLRARRAS